jgi:hypothetical protein
LESCGGAAKSESRATTAPLPAAAATGAVVVVASSDVPGMAPLCVPAFLVPDSQHQYVLQWGCEEAKRLSYYQMMFGIEIANCLD